MSQIREQRCIMATKVFPQKLDLAAVVEHKDCVSDIEEAANPTHLPVRKIGSWREHSLTQVLHYLDKMTQAEATHHKTIAVNNQVYGRSESKIYSCKGINQVPRNLPQDCYSRLWWDSLTKFEQETVSKVAPCGIKNIKNKLHRMQHAHHHIPMQDQVPVILQPQAQETSTPDNQPTKENLGMLVGAQ